ncbi:MAG: redox-sensing transcriptional repressor Rex [Muribaculaceae bacterium]|nr:redox-sensing transcriptional repressor Rex [Muribaculaceae bacterium]
MTTPALHSIIKLPEPTLHRLPWYLAYVKIMQAQGVEHISSTQIAKAINVDASQIAKDLSFVNISGKTRVGYEVNSLVNVLEHFLGFNSQHKAIVYGVGRLGAALMHDSGLAQYGLEIVAGFDVRAMKQNNINGIPLYSVNEFSKKREELDAQIGILTVPVEKAQECADYMIANGIKAIWNFTPYRLQAPKHIVIQDTSIYAHLAVMFNRLNNIRGEEEK